MKKLLLAAICCLGMLVLNPFEALASHLMGGNLTYVYQGLNSGTGLYEYAFTLKIYRLCDAGSSQLPTSMDLGAYEDNTLNPGGNKDRIALTSLPLISQQFITPPNANDSCTFAPNVCVEEGIYTGIIGVPANTTGYYFIADRCCRNNTIANMSNPGASGQAYYAFAPDPSIVNSSPTFAVAPVPFICAGDTVSVLNQAIDPDGDLLTYQFVTPYEGISSNGNPNPNPPASYTWPIPLISYATNFSSAQPFGPGSYTSIDTATGLASYLSPTQGYYVVAVEINEYRNGVLIGVSRLDLQIIVISCPVNPAPNLAPGSTTTTYTIQEGQTLCFNVGFSDSNGDSIFIAHTGDIFNSATTNPAATLSNASGNGSASSQFCWTTSCSQGRTTPYQFSAIATDNGCPAKTTNIVYTINVLNTTKPTSITGPDTLCLDAATGIGYTVNSTSGYTYSWIVTNGTQVSGTNTTTAGVTFNTTGLATVSVVALNSFGCPSDTLRKTVFIKPQPTATAGSDVSFCSDGSATIGGSSTSGYTYSWSPSSGLSSSTISNPVVSVSNTGTTPTTTNYIVTTNLNGCTNEDTVVVTSNPYPVAVAGNNVSICSGGSVPLGALTTSGYTYSWTPTSGLSNNSVSNPVLTLTNTGNTPDTLQYIIQVTNGFTCVSYDTVQVVVRPVPTANAGSDITFCSGQSGNIGATAISGYTYSWSPSTGVTNTTASNTSISLTNSTTVNDTVDVILTTGWFGCTDKDTVAVVVKPIPASNAGTNLYLCSGTTGQIGTLNTAGYTYSWTPSTGLSNNAVSNPTVTLTNTGNTTDTLQYVVTTTLAGCTSTDTVRVVTGPVPVANAGAAATYCSGQSVNIGSASTSGYTYSWTPSTGLSSSTISNPVSAATNTGTTPLVINYSVIATWFGCRDTDFVDITVNPLPISNAGTNQLLCSGSTVQLGTATTSGYTYSWSPSTNLSDPSISNPTLSDTITATDPDTLFYTVTTTLNGCTTTDDVTVILSPVPTAVAGSDVTFCSGQSASFGTTSTANYSYTWSPATGLSSSTSSNPTVTLTNSTTNVTSTNYIVTTNLFGCIDKDTVTAFVKPLPVSEAGAATSLCNGDTIFIGTTSTSGYTYSWSPGTGLSSTTISDPQLSIINTGTTANTVYYTVTTTLNGCTTTDSVAVTSNPLPNVAASANPIAICIGNSTTLTASGAPNFSWALLSSPGLSIGSGANLTVSPTTTTSYIVTGTSAALCLNYDTVLVTVNPLPNVQISTTNPQMCDGDTITLNGSGATNYTWTEIPSGVTIGTSTNVDVHPTTNTSYVLTGVDGNSCVNKDTIDITVNPAATISGITGTLSVCPGVTGVQYWVINPNSTSTYNWNITNGTVAAGQGNDTVNVDWSSISGNGSVSVIETTDKGCNSDPIILPVTINVILTPVAPTGTQTLCSNVAQGQAYATINTPGSTYTWHAQGGTITQGNGTNSVLVDWGVTGPQTVALWYEEASVTADTVCFGISDTLYVTINPAPQTSAITGNSSICVSDTGSFTITNTSGSNYNWTITGGSVINGNGSNGIQAIWSGSPSAVVSVQETNSYGCIGTPVTYNVTVNPLPNASAGSNDTICTGNSTTLNASGGISYSWTPGTALDNTGIANPIANPTSTTTYSVLVTDANGCKKSAAVTVVVNSLPIISAGNNTAICIGSSTTLNGTGGTSYSWSPSTGLDNPNSASPSANPTATTTYTVIGTDNNGCSNTSNVIVTVNPLPVADAGSPDVICNGGSINLTATGGVTYSWSPATGLNNPSSASPIASPTATTTYTVTVTDINGCTDDDQVEISVNDQPTADFTVDSLVTVIGCEGVEVSIVNNSTNALQYQWTLGDGTSTTDVNINHLYAFSGALNITLIAQNNQCADTLTKSFTPGLLADFLSNIPNVFTPNNDGVNDCFNLGSKTNFDDCSSWQVFNRWGAEVFSSGPGKECWNGKKDNDGELLPTGTYFYILKIAGGQYKGSVMLVQ